jgi:major membrane immunogen (membrane-anchored lipoprotein)
MKKLLIIVIGVLLVGCSMDEPNYKDKLIGTWTNKYNWDYTLNNDYDEWQLIISENTIQLRMRHDDGTYYGSRYSFDNCDESMIYYTSLNGSGKSFTQGYYFHSDNEIEFLSGSGSVGLWSGTLIKIK